MVAAARIDQKATVTGGLVKEHLYTGVVSQIWLMRDDGDTFRTLLDLGHHTYADAKIRLIRIDAPDVSKGYTQEQVDASRDYLRARFAEALSNGRDFWVVTVKKQRSFDRYLSEVYIDGVNINDEMIQKGYAVPYAN